MSEITFNWCKGHELSQSEQSKIARMNTAFQWTRNMSKSDFQFDFTYYLVMYSQMKIVGYVGLHYIIDEFQINTVYIDPLFRRKGLGKLLLRQLLNLSQQNKVRRIILEVRSKNIGAIKLYQLIGFQEISRRKNYYHQPKDDAYILEYNIKKEGVKDDTDIIH